MRRHTANPIITPADVKPSMPGFEVAGVFNAGAAAYGGEVILLLRVAERPAAVKTDTVRTAFFDTERSEIATRDFSLCDEENDFSDPRFVKRRGRLYLTSISHFRIARSTDGVSFRIDERPAVSPADEYEAFGLEDPRISLIDGTYWIAYAAVSPMGVVTRLASTVDFAGFCRHGTIFCPENKDVAIFEGKAGQRYFALHRPVSPLFGAQDIWIAESPDLASWGNHRRLFGTRPGMWDESKIGAGAQPIRTEDGWLEIYHGADRNQRYCLGAALLETEKPWRVIARSLKPVLQPESDFEKHGFFGRVVFTCGLLAEKGGLRIYYGAADTSLCLAEVSLEELLAELR